MTKPTTLGEFRVGIDFNPSGDDRVGQIKRHAADLIDLISGIPDGTDYGTVAGPERTVLKERAQRMIEDAAMVAVKAATKREPQ